jgi:hypothetical protein
MTHQTPETSIVMVFFWMPIEAYRSVLKGFRGSIGNNLYCYLMGPEGPKNA